MFIICILESFTNCNYNFVNTLIYVSVLVFIPHLSYSIFYYYIGIYDVFSAALLQKYGIFALLNRGRSE